VFGFVTLNILTGMGAEFCKHLRKQGWRTFASARRLEAMEELQAFGCEVPVSSAYFSER
jgi:NADP-dependent 3-hydroxy acid dehydrogenase YdfG